MSLPDFLLIGTAKAGTTSLYDYLGQHPSVFMSPVKEPYFFAFRDNPPRFAGPGDETLNSRAVASLADYHALFAEAPADAVKGEASTNYLYHPSAPRNIADLLPRAKLVAILREPIARAYSSWLDLRRDGREPETSFVRALDLEPARISANWQHMWHYMAMGRYAEQLRRYYEHFPENQLKIILYDDLVADPQRVVADVFRFIGVDASFRPNLTVRHNAGGMPKSRLLHAVLTRPSAVRRTAKALLPSRLRPALRRQIARLRKRNLETSFLSDAERAVLERRFEEEVSELSGLIGRDLSMWQTARARP